MIRISRRRALLALGVGSGLVVAAAGAGVALVDAEVLPGKSVLNNTLGRCDAAAPAAALRGTPGPIVTGTMRSVRRRREVGFAIAYPPGYAAGAALPVCLALHGYGSDARGAIGCAGYPDFIAGAVRSGMAPFALAAVDGGNGYWHPHAADDPLGMIFDEFLPLLRTRGLDVSRPAVAGWSMGGYGALLCGLTRPDTFAAIVASSPAIFHSYADAKRVNPGAYDSAREWAAYDMTARARELTGLPVHIAIGAADPFAPAVATLRGRMADPSAVRVATGCHDGRFWTWAAPDQVRLIGSALAGRS
ncbi:alpha/beta hydrolase [Rugosimonospora africana]|nr:alpha/beta hydrolase-fold protein [Rugosimonospora africana]